MNTTYYAGSENPKKVLKPIHMRKNLTTSGPPVLSKFEERNYLPPVLDTQRKSTNLETSKYPISTPDKH